MIADLGRDRLLPCPAGVLAAEALTRSRSASDRPAPKAPIFRKLRRLMPSQKPCLAPQNVNMLVPPLIETRDPVPPDSEIDRKRVLGTPQFENPTKSPDASLADAAVGKPTGTAPLSIMRKTQREEPP